MDPSTWDGAAITMGNSTKTWRQSYAPTLKNRSVQGVVDGYSNFTSQINWGPHKKPRIPSSSIIPSQSAQHPPPITDLQQEFPPPQRKQLIMPFMCLPQPQIGEVDAILVGERTGKKRKSGSRPLSSNFDWGGEWEGW